MIISLGNGLATVRWQSSYRWVNESVITKCKDAYRHRYQSRYVPSQWETSLQCKDVSHWLGAYLDWSLQASSGLHELIRWYSNINDTIDHNKITSRFHIRFENKNHNNGHKQIITCKLLFASLTDNKGSTIKIHWRLSEVMNRQLVSNQGSNCV